MDIKAVSEEINEVAEIEHLPRCLALGHFLLAGFFQMKENFIKILDLIIALYKEKAIGKSDVEEG